jgi:hypothetical protein
MLWRIPAASPQTAICKHELASDVAAVAKAKFSYKLRPSIVYNQDEHIIRGPTVIDHSILTDRLDP